MTELFIFLWVLATPALGAGLAEYTAARRTKLTENPRPETPLEARKKSPRVIHHPRKFNPSFR